MSRRRRSVRRTVAPDPQYDDVRVSRFINVIMRGGKRSVAESIVYAALEESGKSLGKKPLEIFHKALENVMPLLEVRSRRVGGATYQVPVEVRPTRRESVAYRWIMQAALQRSGKSMKKKLGSEIQEAFEERGGAMKKREQVHRMADANRAFSHYRW